MEKEVFFHICVKHSEIHSGRIICLTLELTASISAACSDYRIVSQRYGTNPAEPYLENVIRVSRECEFSLVAMNVLSMR